MKKIYGGIEAGGTKINCIVAIDPNNVIEEVRITTTAPQETLTKVKEFFKKFSGISSIGIACFGPLDLNPQSSTYGYITSTPKLEWQNTDIRGWISQELNLPVAIDTDVNAAALAEGKWGACQGLDTYVYITIGTGVGGGAIVNGLPLHGLVHPEMGHLVLPHDLNNDPFPGCCPFHHDCFEGLACGPAINLRWKASAESLPISHPAWELEAHYISLALQTIICTLSPERIVLGGGVMQRSHLFPIIRQKTQKLLNDYIRSEQILKKIETYIVPPALGSRSGVCGAIALALNL